MKTFEDVPVESVQEYWNNRPCNIRHSNKEVGSLEYFDEVSWRKYFVEPHIPRFADFDKWKGKRVLEVGCGIGTVTMSFAKAGAHVTAVDLSDESVKIARQRAEVYGLTDKIDFKVGNAEHLSDFVDVEPYDLIFSFGVIHHSPHPDAIVREMRKYCHDKTQLRVMVYHRNSYKVASIILSQPKSWLGKVSETVATYSEAQSGCPITYIYSRDEGAKLLEDNGFDVVRTEVDHIFPYNIPDYVQYKYVKLRHFAMMPPGMMRALECAYGWHLCLTALPG